jgi:hypothetical protein
VEFGRAAADPLAVLGAVFLVDHHVLRVSG